MTLRWHCFGGFRIEDDGRELDLTAIRPRSRTLLRYLAAAGGRAVHRERILDALWPELTETAAVNSLHVAVSTVRTFLEPGVARGASRYLVRDGLTYRLDTGAPENGDVTAFDQAAAAGRRAARAGRTAEATVLLRTALRQYTGELLPEDGAADWVVADRNAYRARATAAAGLLAELELGADHPAAAADAARRALELDDLDDTGWRRLITAQQRSGDHAAAARTRAGYETMLRSLGVPVMPLPHGHRAAA
ncbi:MAG TPA: BTAD domain-containing putative transcriptional regulator [Actinoplanes sp.]|nr:BTAD domain-containing putative transcriptional regulator [Actinoplanes sp.]